MQASPFRHSDGWTPSKPMATRSLLGAPLAGHDAGDRDALPLTPQGASLTLRHRLLLAVDVHADAGPLPLALRRFSADTLAALLCKRKRDRLTGAARRGAVQAHCP